jgi:hypothetical protein
VKRKTEFARIQPLDPDGRPNESGKVVFISISMSSATQESLRFNRLAGGDAAKSSKLAIVDCVRVESA